MNLSFLFNVLLNWISGLPNRCSSLLSSHAITYEKKQLKEKPLLCRRPDAWQQRQLHSWAMSLDAVTVPRRHSMSTPVDLYNLDRTVIVNEIGFKVDSSVTCYGCCKLYRTCHPVYIFSCQKCGDLFQKMRTLSRDLTGKVCVVIGARTKLGHQIVVKLLDAGATVIGTSRYPEKALQLFEQYPRWEEWKTRLVFYPKSFDLDTFDLSAALSRLKEFILHHSDHIDILINSAAQTIRSREKTVKEPLNETNRYGNDKFVPDDASNSWNHKLADIRQYEMEEVYRVNAIAPALMIQILLPLLKACTTNPYVINVHAREGLFGVQKDDRHVHTNMAKAALSMLTRCLAGCNYSTTSGHKIWFHGIDPGWISYDEYCRSSLPIIVPPLDEVDGAARILYPVMAHLQGSFKCTRRHFLHFKL